MTANPTVDIAADTQITFVKNGWSLFKSTMYQLANETVEDISMHLPVTSTILNLVSVSRDYSRSVPTNMMCFKDTGPGTAAAVDLFRLANTPPVIAGPDDVGTLTNITAYLVLLHAQYGTAPSAGNVADNIRNALIRPCNEIGTITPPGAADNAAALLRKVQFIVPFTSTTTYNDGYIKRRKFTHDSSQITMILPLSTIFGFCLDYNKVFRGIKHTLILDRADQNDCLMKAAGVDDAQFIFSLLALCMPRVVPSIDKTIELVDHVYQEIVFYAKQNLSNSSTKFD